MTALRQGYAPRSPRRIDSIDFWRGLVLCAIFTNHVPGNIFEHLTQKNFGFSDSAEAFVFLSGVSMALAYAPRFANGRALEVIGTLGRRAVRLYATHIVLSLAAIGIFSLGVLATGDDALLDVHGRDLFVDDPQAALIGLVSLGHQLGYFNILPLYIILLAWVPPMLWIGRRQPALMVVVSVLAYIAARTGGWNMPTWPMKGTWFFDPFAWQVLIAAGLWAGLRLRHAPLPRTWPLVATAICIVAFGAVSVTDGFSFLPGLYDWTRDWADLDKGVLGTGRLVHFAALAYLLHVTRAADILRGTVVFAPLCRLGRNSLVVFALLSLLAAVGQVLADRFGHSLPVDGLLIGGGLATLYGAVLLLETRRPTLLAGVEAQAALGSPRRG